MGSAILKQTRTTIYVIVTWILAAVIYEILTLKGEPSIYYLNTMKVLNTFFQVYAIGFLYIFITRYEKQKLPFYAVLTVIITMLYRLIWKFIRYPDFETTPDITMYEAQVWQFLKSGAPILIIMIMEIIIGIKLFKNTSEKLQQEIKWVGIAYLFETIGSQILFLILIPFHELLCENQTAYNIIWKIVTFISGHSVAATMLYLYWQKVKQLKGNSIE